VLSTLVNLRHQLFPAQDFEVIVVDNGSKDGTLSAVEAFMALEQQAAQDPEQQWQARCLSEGRNGLAYARNTALLAATGEIAVFVDDDTLIDQHMLAHLWQAYQETGADAIGMRVAMHWDITPPHWMINELLGMLGHFSPTLTRSQLGPDESFASCAFSVKRSVLQAINYVTPLMGRRATLPGSAEVFELCWQLHQAGYSLWYEPQAVVYHRVTSARLQQAFFVGRAYWQGRAEIIQRYRHAPAQEDKEVWKEVWQELGNYARCLLLQTPLLHLAGRPTSERMLGAIEQSYSLGRLVQRLIYLEHIPAEQETPAVLLVQSQEADTAFRLLTRALDKQGIGYLLAKPEIPLGWLWRHRTYKDQPAGIIHFYRPGALQLTRSQNQRLLFRLWLARCLGLRVVVTDSGGWWHGSRLPRFRARRALEHKLLHTSHAIISSTRQPGQLYRNSSLRKRTRRLVQPGFRGYFPPALPTDTARTRLGLHTPVDFLYLCLAHLHTEREIIFLTEAFRLLTLGSRRQESLSDVQLLIVGQPVDNENSARLAKQAKRDRQVKLYPAPFKESDLPVYMGASNAYVLPHLATHTAGHPESASLALSYHKLVIAPDLPRYSGTLPQRASLPYVAGSRESLAEALIKAQQINFSLQEEESLLLDAQQSWQQHARELLAIYRTLLGQSALE
jgi:glycosyltransferase involved in cell wall biosynthesis